MRAELIAGVREEDCNSTVKNFAKSTHEGQFIVRMTDSIWCSLGV